MKKYAYLGTNADLAEKYASVLHDLVCTNDLNESQHLVDGLHIISTQIVNRFMEDNGYLRNGAMLWVKAEKNGECAARERRAESEVNNANQSKNRSESEGFDT